MEKGLYIWSIRSLKTNYMKANNAKEAMSFFLSNSGGTILCVKNGAERRVDCYPDAVDFFKDELT